MMKKFGFTLAEVLITLGIIGVVAALTAPALVQNAGTAKIGPTLAKVVSTLENANEQILHDEDATDLSKLCDGTDTLPVAQCYADKLINYISGSSYDEREYFESGLYESNAASSFGTTIFHFGNIDIALKGRWAGFIYDKKGSFKGNFLTLTEVDINGQKAGPNKYGKDIFTFTIDKGGSVIPCCGKTYSWLLNSETITYESDEDRAACNENKVSGGLYCAGSVFDNNMKVIYQ